MARNEEKAASMMNRWTTLKESMASGRMRTKRPYLASEVTNLGEAEHWRRDLIKNVSRKVMEIQNASLGEARIRDLNDEINRLLREKWHWERQIKTLGGTDYSGWGANFADAGTAAPGGKGYKYFGAAKDLPGVRELFIQEEVVDKKRTRRDIYKGIDPDYFGYRDEDDGTLLEVEAAAEKTRVAGLVAKHAEEKSRRKRVRMEAAPAASAGAGAVPADSSDEDSDVGGADALTNAEVKSNVVVPSQKDIEKLIMERKRKALLDMYASGSLQQQQSEAKQLLNVNQAK